MREKSFKSVALITVAGGDDGEGNGNWRWR